MQDHLGLNIRNGDVKAFETFFRMYHSRLCSFANKFLNDQEKSKEIVQDAFVKIWEGRSEINPEDSIKSYVFKITQNLCLNVLKREKVESRYANIYKFVYLSDNEYSAQDSLMAKELEEKITSSIKKLPVECRKVFELSRKGGYKYKEIADISSISIKTVEAQMTKALRFLRIELSEYLTVLFVSFLLKIIIF